MHKYILLLVVVLTTSCKKDVNSLFTYQFEVQVPMFPSTNTVITYHVVDDFVVSQLEAKMTEHNVRFEDIKTIQPMDIQIYPLGRPLSYGILQHIRVDIFEVSDPDDLILLAEEYPRLNEPSGTMDLLPGLSNVKDIVSQDVFGIDVGYRLRHPLAESLSNVVRIKLDVVGY